MLEWCGQELLQQQPKDGMPEHVGSFLTLAYFSCIWVARVRTAMEAGPLAFIISDLASSANTGPAHFLFVIFMSCSAPIGTQSRINTQAEQQAQNYHMKPELRIGLRIRTLPASTTQLELPDLSKGISLANLTQFPAHYS